MHDVSSLVPSRFPDEIVLIEEYGWSWREIQETPAVLIDELLTRIRAMRKCRSEKQKRDDSKARVDAMRNKKQQGR